jgi:hypothetical protein
MELKARFEAGEREVDLALREAEREAESIERRRSDRLNALSNLGVVRAGPVRYIGTFYVVPGSDITITKEFVEDQEAKKASEEAAMKRVMDHEIDRGWEPEDVSREKVGFDIRSLSKPEPMTGKRDVRRIEVKGRQRGEPVRLTENEWRKAKQLRDTYWLYVVWNPREKDQELVLITDPANTLGAYVKEVKSISHYEITADTIMRFGKNA